MAKRETTVRGIVRDPTLDQVLKLMDQGHHSAKYLSEKSGVAATTIYNWRHGKTRRPQNVTMDFVLRAMGYKRTITRM
jgi:hypothetical protein